MLAVSPFFPTFEWEYPMPIIGTEQQILHNFDMDDSISDAFPNFQSFPLQAVQDNYDVISAPICDVPPEELIVSSPNDQLGDKVLAKKRLNHNASERDRRKKINSLYSALRSSLPATEHSKKLSIPSTVARVLKYIPELRKEVENLTQKKDELLSKTCVPQEGHPGVFLSQEEEEIKYKTGSSSCSIAVNKMDERDIVIHFSTLGQLPLPEVLLLLEQKGLNVIDISCFQSSEGKTIGNVHLLMGGSNIVHCEMLKEELLIIIERLNS